MAAEDDGLVARLDPAVDAIGLEIVWGRLVTIMDEVDTAVLRTAFSSVVVEGRDSACVLLDPEGRSLAQSTFSITGFTVTLPRTAKLMLAELRDITLDEGDVLATNDPWIGAGHLPDFNLISPVFLHGRLVAFMGTAAHLADVGGRLGYFNAVDVFEEGIRLPPCRLFTRGQPDPLIFRLLEANLRSPDLVLGDLTAIAAAHRFGADRLRDLMEEYELQSLDSLAETILARSSHAMENAIERIPPGTYSSDVVIDGYDEPVVIRAALTIGERRIVVDFAGSSPQTTAAAINLPWSMTNADTVHALKCVLAPELRNNEGLFWPITVGAPEGSILNAQPPHAVQGRTKIATHIHAVIFSALADALPGHVQAGSGGAWLFAASGYRADGSRYASHFFPHGGKGATAEMDGLATTSFPYNAAAGSIEVYENIAPLLIERKELLTDSGGPGQRRGGLGQEVVFVAQSDLPTTVWMRPDKVRHPAIGLHRGLPGICGSYVIRGESPIQPTTYNLKAGDRVVLRLPGGGGYGDPWTRDAEVVARDVRLGYVSREAAVRDYGVTLTDAGVVDADATSHLRRSRHEMSVLNAD